jgi:hypothetical protein
MADVRVDDIALFFSDGGQLAKRWVSHQVYADPAFKIGPVPSEWQGATFLERPSGAAGSPPFYVANLSTLLDPGTPAAPAAASRRAPDPKAPLTPQAGDLVIVPWDDPNNAYLVPKARYSDQTVCPPISDTNGADLRFMAITEGVVVANVPKTDLAGMTCYLLNLLALRSSAPFPGQDKTKEADLEIRAFAHGQTPQPSPRR